MTLNEKLNFFEEKYGKLENWTVHNLLSIVEDETQIEVFCERKFVEFIEEKCPEAIKTTMQIILLLHEIANSNEQFEEILENDADDEGHLSERANNFLKEKLSSEDLLSRLNAALVILGNQNSSEEMLSLIKKESIAKDMQIAEERMLQLSPEEGIPVIQELVKIMFRIQEFYFERYKENVYDPSVKFSNMLDEISKNIEKEMLEMMRQYGINGDENEEKA